MNDIPQSGLGEVITSVLASVGDSVFLVFGPIQAAKLRRDADEIDRKVAEVRARRDAARRKNLLMSYVAAGVKPPQALIDNPDTTGDTK